MQGIQIRSLGRELRSSMAHSVAKQQQQQKDVHGIFLS